MTRIFASALLLLLMSACGDCMQEVSGIVLDSATGQPLQGVSVFKKKQAGYPYRYRFNRTICLIGYLRRLPVVVAHGRTHGIHGLPKYGARHSQPRRTEGRIA